MGTAISAPAPNVLAVRPKATAWKGRMRGRSPFLYGGKISDTGGLGWERGPGRLGQQRGRWPSWRRTMVGRLVGVRRRGVLRSCGRQRRRWRRRDLAKRVLGGQEWPGRSPGWALPGEAVSCAELLELGCRRRPGPARACSRETSCPGRDRLRRCPERRCLERCRERRCLETERAGPPRRRRGKIGCHFRRRCRACPAGTLKGAMRFSAAEDGATGTICAGEDRQSSASGIMRRAAGLTNCTGDAFRIESSCSRGAEPRSLWPAACPRDGTLPR